MPQPPRPPAPRLLVPLVGMLAAQTCACSGPVGVSEKRPPARDCPAAQDDAGGTGPAAQLARALGRSDHFLIGTGNDLVGIDGDAHSWALPAPADVHYLYLVGLPGTEEGWPAWNADGTYIDRHMVVAQEQCALPMFTLYAMATRGENNMEVLQDADFMAAWWAGLSLALDRMDAVGGPALLHVEPDFWGFAQKAAPDGDPHQLPVLVGAAADDCEDLPDTLVGMGACIARLAEDRAPEVAIGLHASVWADPDPAATAAFLTTVGGGAFPLLFVETLDRDAGCFEAQAPRCRRDDGPWYWDESNTRSPNFAEHLSWAQRLHTASGKPLMWWQMPLGVPSDTPGGAPGAWRDNRVRYLFAHPDEFAAAGGIGAAFGPGQTGQTTLATDGGQFAAAIAAQAAAPTPLP